MQRVDMTGEKIGKWTFVCPSKKLGHWIVRCECGNERSVSRSNIVYGGSKSCGCERLVKIGRDIVVEPPEVVGLRFNHLVVTEILEQEEDTLFVCQCDCGKQTTLPRDYVRGGVWVSCGCVPAPGKRGNKYDRRQQRFGRLLVLEPRGQSFGGEKWQCICDCGNELVTRTGNLQTGCARSCGCYSVDINRELKTVHGMSFTPEHNTWQGMIGRCSNEYDLNYRNYGERGIRVCARWLDGFQNFFDDMGPRPSPEHSLDRINVNGDYSPENCRWATKTEQNRNKRDNLNITHNGETLSVAEWAERLGISAQLLRQRIFVQGWPVEEAMTAKKFKRRNVVRVRSEKYEKRSKAKHAVSVALRSGKLVKPDRCQHTGCSNPAKQTHHHKGFDPENFLDVIWLCKQHHTELYAEKIELNGITKQIKEWANELGIGVPALRARLKSKLWTKEKALTTPKRADQDQTWRKRRKRRLTSKHHSTHK
jgi:hypothetical protein